MKKYFVYLCLSLYTFICFAEKDNACFSYGKLSLSPKTFLNHKNLYNSRAYNDWMNSIVIDAKDSNSITFPYISPNKLNVFEQTAEYLKIEKKINAIVENKLNNIDLSVNQGNGPGFWTSMASNFAQWALGVQDASFKVDKIKLSGTKLGKVDVSEKNDNALSISIPLEKLNLGVDAKIKIKGEKTINLKCLRFEVMSDKPNEMLAISQEFALDKGTHKFTSGKTEIHNFENVLDIIKINTSKCIGKHHDKRLLEFINLYKKDFVQTLFKTSLKTSLVQYIKNAIIDSSNKSVVDVLNNISFSFDGVNFKDSILQQLLKKSIDLLSSKKGRSYNNYVKKIQKNLEDNLTIYDYIRNFDLINQFLEITGGQSPKIEHKLNIAKKSLEKAEKIQKKLKSGHTLNNNELLTLKDFVHPSKYMGQTDDEKREYFSIYRPIIEGALSYMKKIGSEHYDPLSREINKIIQPESFFDVNLYFDKSEDGKNWEVSINQKGCNKVDNTKLKFKGKCKDKEKMQGSIFLGVDDMNAMLKKMHRQKMFNFCLSPSSVIGACSSQKNKILDFDFSMKDAPSIYWNKRESRYEVQLSDVNLKSQKLQSMFFTKSIAKKLQNNIDVKIAFQLFDEDKCRNDTKKEFVHIAEKKLCVKVNVLDFSNPFLRKLETVFNYKKVYQTLTSGGYLSAVCRKISESLFDMTKIVSFFSNLVVNNLLLPVFEMFFPFAEFEKNTAVVAASSSAPNPLSYIKNVCVETDEDKIGLSFDVMQKI